MRRYSMLQSYFLGSIDRFWTRVTTAAWAATWRLRLHLALLCPSVRKWMFPRTRQSAESHHEHSWSLQTTFISKKKKYMYLHQNLYHVRFSSKHPHLFATYIVLFSRNTCHQVWISHMSSCCMQQKCPEGHPSNLCVHKYSHHEQPEWQVWTTESVWERLPCIRRL